MRSNRHTTLLLAGVLTLTAGCRDDPTLPVTGSIAVSVIDLSMQVPVADVEIMIAPSGLVATTDDEGMAIFEVPRGDYFVDASVCCSGPGFIDYHVPVVVTGGETVVVNLEACLACQ